MLFIKLSCVAAYQQILENFLRIKKEDTFTLK
jgi:hypothetical protein